MNHRITKSEMAASLVEAALILLLVALVAISSLTAVKDKFEVVTWSVGIWIINPVTYQPDGSSVLEVWAPASVFRYYNGPSIEPHAWAKVRRVTCNTCDRTNATNLPLVITAGDIISYADKPTD